MIKTKKAQIGETITWFLGFIIIFFIIMLFTFFTIIYFASTSIKIEITETSINEIINKDNQIFFSFLNSETNYNNQNIKIKDLIVKYYETKNENIKKEIIKIFRDKFNENYYYYFKISKDDTILVFNKNIDIENQNEVYIIDSGGIKINYYIERK